MPLAAEEEKTWWCCDNTCFREFIRELVYYSIYQRIWHHVSLL